MPREDIASLTTASRCESKHPVAEGVGATAAEERFPLALEPRRELIEFTETGLLTMARPFAAPPDVPADRAKALQQAFAATHRDKEFLADAEKIGIFISPVTADEIMQSIERMTKASPALIERVRQIMGGK
jgi:hypothetical protein